VRTTALRTVTLVMEAVGDPQPLSYLLPGLVGGLSKAILAGKDTYPLSHAVEHPNDHLVLRPCEES
jgi:hypothetical protein